MIRTAILAGAVIVASVASASARDAWVEGRYPYARHHHSVCQDKAARLHAFERRAASDGRITRREREIMHDLQRDLDRTCGGFRRR